ncbi:MAG: galactitol-1-phosphate 5-dehydrogenase, partial [Intestinibacter sp.]
VSAPFPGKEWINAVDYIGKKVVDVNKLITHKFKLSEGPEVFEKILANRDEFGKVLFFPEWDEK